MRFVKEFRDGVKAQKLVKAIEQITTKDWVIMEVCGGQTHAILRSGIDQLLPPKITLVHGPGCPVCVTSAETIDKALAIAAMPKVIFCSFGDMLRVPGIKGDLLSVKASGGDVRLVYSPLDTLKLAMANHKKEVVFFAVGFETTAPMTAMTVYQAKRLGIKNFSLLVAHFRIPPAIEAILASPENKVQGFLAPGHVCTVMGYTEYEALSQKSCVPIVVTGFEPLDILQGIFLCVRQLEEGRAETENQYTRSVRREGNQHAIAIINEVFERTTRKWRGIGEIPESGLRLRAEYAEFDAECKFELQTESKPIDTGCISGLVLQGIKKPYECPHFASKCTPEHPLGATMVSSEGTCSAYYRYRCSETHLANIRHLSIGGE